MSDIKLIFDINKTKSKTAISEGLKDIISKIENTDVTKIKFTFDYNKAGLNELESQISRIAQMAQVVQSTNIIPTFNSDNVSDRKMSQATAILTQQKLQTQQSVDIEKIETEKIKKQIQNIKLQRQLTQQSNAAQQQVTRQANAQISAEIKNNVKYNQLYDYMNKYSANFSKAKYSSLYNEGQTLLSKFYSGSEKDVKQAEQQVSKFTAKCREAGIQTESFGTKISRLFSVHFDTALAMVGVHLIQQGLRELYQNVVDIDTAMTELKKVTNETDEVYSNFLNNTSQRAEKLGATVSDTINATADFARLGYNLEDASQLADAAIVYKNVGDGITDISNASESIISTMQAFGVSADDVMSIVDKFNEVGNNYAISSKGVGDALLRSAAAMHTANNSLDQTIALATAANTVVQNPEKVGTTLKTVSMYLRAAKTEAEEAGESTVGMAKSVSELRNEILSLTNQQVDIQIDDGTFKSTYQILGELSKVWSDLSDVSQANILEMIGGKRNSNVVAAILENFNVAEKALTTAGKSSGSALSENEKVLESINGKMQIFQAAFESFSYNALDSDLIKGFITIGTWIVKGADALQEWNMLIPGIISGILAVKKNFGIITVQNNGTSGNIYGGLLGNYANNLSGSYTAGANEGLFQQFNAAVSSENIVQIDKYITSIKNTNKALGEYLEINRQGSVSMAGFQGYLKSTGVSLNLATIKTWALNTALTALNALTMAGLFAVVSLAVSWVSDLVVTTAEWEEKLQNVKSELSELESEGESLNNELKTTQDRINELQNKGSLTLVEENELKRLQQENAELQRKIDLNRIAQQEKQKETRETFVDTMESDIFEDDNYSIDYNLDGRVVAGGGGKKVNESAYINQQFEDYKDYQDQLAQLEQDYLSNKISKDKYNAEKEIIDDQIKNISEYLKGKYEDFAENSEGLEYITDPKTPEDEKYNEYLDYINEFNDRYIVALGDTESIQNLWSNILNRTKFSEAKTALDELGSSGELTAKKIAELAQSNDNIAELLAYLNKIGLIDLSKVVTDTNKDGLISADEIKNTKDFGDALDGIPGMFNKVKGSAKDTEEAVSDLADTFDKLDQASDAFGSLNKAFGELKDDGKIAFSTLDSIQEKFSKLGNVDDGWLQDKINALAEAKGNTEATNKVLGELAQKYVSAQFTAEELANANQAVVASMLEEQGVANADKVAMQMIAQAKMQAAIESGDFSDTTWNEINALLSESGATQAASQALAIYNTNKMLADKTTFDNTDSINKLLNEAKAAGVTGSQYEKLLRIKELSEQFDKTKDPRGKSSIKSEIRQIQKSMSSDIEFKPIQFTGVPNNNSSSSSSSSSSDKSYTATEDPWLKKRQAELDKVAHQHEMGKISEEKYLDKIQKIEKKFAPKIKKKTNEINKLKIKYSKLSKDNRKSKSGKKLKADLEQAKEDLNSIKEQDKDLKEEIHKLKLDDRKEEYENYQTKQINKYIDGKIDKKELEKRLKNKLKSLFKNFDKDTYNEYLSSMGEDISEAMADRLNSEMDELDNQRDFDLISESDYYKEKLKLAESYYNKSKEFADEYTDALVEMYDYAKDQYLDDLEEQKEALEDQKEVISDFYETQRELLQDQSDNDTYLKDQSEKRKNINDLKLQLTELEKDTSEKSKKRIAELQDELANAQDELTEFEKQHTLDQTIAMLEEMEEKHLKNIDKQIGELDNQITSINDNTGNIYKAVVDFAKKEYDVDIDVSKIGLKAYASGTSSSVGGGVITQEKGSEAVAINKINGYTLLTPNSMVWSNEQTKKLWELSKNPENLLKQYTKDAENNIAQVNSVNTSNNEYNININEGAVIIQGNADEKVLNESNQKLTYNILNELKRLKSK